MDRSPFVIIVGLGSSGRVYGPESFSVVLGRVRSPVRVQES
jgi:hypothetical protein